MEHDVFPDNAGRKEWQGRGRFSSGNETTKSNIEYF